MRSKQQVLEIVRLLEEEYPLADCTLDYEKPYELLTVSYTHLTLPTKHWV